jgi:hypothetical protein
MKAVPSSSDRRSDFTVKIGPKRGNERAELVQRGIRHPRRQRARRAGSPCRSKEIQMNTRKNCLLVAIALFLPLAPAFAADAAPVAPSSACSTELTSLPPWLALTACADAFCNNDDDCRSACPNATTAICNVSTETCTYSFSSGGGPGTGSCQSGALCLPLRDCFDNSDCASCTGGCAGFCAPDGVCRLL